MANKYSVSVDFIASTNIEKIADAMSRNFREIQAASKRLTDTLDKNRDGFDAIERSATKAAKAVGTTFVAAIGASVLVGSQFEQGLQELAAITGLQGEALQAFGEDALAMSKSMGVAATSYLDGVKLIASAKPELLKSPELLKAITDESLILAKAATMSLGEAAESVTTSMNQFQLEALESTRVINVLAAGSKLGNSFVMDTSDALRNAGVSARFAGVSFEETNAAIQVLASGGLSGVRAGTALKAVFLAMAAQGDDFNPKIVGITKALDNYAAAGLDVTKMEKIFQREGLNAAAILIEQRKAFGQLVQDMTGTSIAYEQAAVNMQTFSEETKKMGATIQASLIRLFLRMRPVLTDVVVRIAKFFDYVGDNLEAVTAFATTVAVLTAAMYAFILPTKILTFLPIAKQIISMTAAMWSFNTALLANPITWIVVAVVAAIAALTYVVWKYWDIIKPAFVDVWEQAKAAFGPSLATLWELLQQLWTVAKPVLGFIAKVVGVVLVSAFLGFMKVLQWVLKYFEIMFKPLAWLLEKIQGLIDKKKELSKDTDFNVKGSIPDLNVPDSVSMLGGMENQLNINMKVDAEGRPSMEDVYSDGDINFEAEFGSMLPAFGG